MARRNREIAQLYGDATGRSEEEVLLLVVTTTLAGALTAVVGAVHLVDRLTGGSFPTVRGQR